MAVLNVKNVPDELYEQLRRRAARERRSIAQELLHILERALAEEKEHSILELRGLGREVWRGIDAVDHVAGERDSWD